MTNIHFSYELSNGTALKAKLKYSQRYTNNGLPYSKTLTKLHLCLHETGAISKSRTMRYPQLKDQVLQIIHENSETSSIKICQQLIVSYKTV